jgi:excisionase family DNA binding protein
MSSDTVKEQIATITPTIGLDGAAQLLRCNPDTVRKLAKAGELPGTKVGRSWVFYTDSLIEWLNARIEAGTASRGDPMRTGVSSLAARLANQRAQRIALKRGKSW